MGRMKKGVLSSYGNPVFFAFCTNITFWKRPACTLISTPRNYFIQQMEYEET